MITQASIDEWYPVAWFGGLALNVPRKTVLMGQEITITRLDDGKADIIGPDGATLLSLVGFDHLWTSLGTPKHGLFKMDEALHDERRHVPCGSIKVRCSPLRAVENFLDIAHFPYVHTGILGEEDHPEVRAYKVTEEDNEIWAKQVQFFQPQAAVSAEGGIITDYMYRVPAPTVAVLYKTCPTKEEEWDIITLFVQPTGEQECIVWPWMSLYDDENGHTDLIHFQQTIFLQDRSILENQIPKLLPLDPKSEVPTKADLTSIAYRRWLKKRGLFYGAETEAA